MDAAVFTIVVTFHMFPFLHFFSVSVLRRGESSNERSSSRWTQLVSVLRRGKSGLVIVLGRSRRAISCSSVFRYLGARTPDFRPRGQLVSVPPPISGAFPRLIVSVPRRQLVSIPPPISERSRWIESAPLRCLRWPTRYRCLPAPVRRLASAPIGGPPAIRIAQGTP